MGWVNEHLCSSNQSVRGFIIAQRKDQKLEYALKQVNNIEFLKYELDFRLTTYIYQKYLYMVYPYCSHSSHPFLRTLNKKNVRARYLPISLPRLLTPSQDGPHSPIVHR